MTFHHFILHPLSRILYNICMATTIHVLDDHTINQIAAGEVIENPASVVKELVENSLDAGATDIHVEIRAGGRQLIRVTDNGCGMNEDDALLCLERHATSKIRAHDDLNAVSTMGFRGEAMPSIAAISKFTLLTCASGEEGTLIAVDGGKIFQCGPAARAQGTTVEIKSLFFNVPARRKFQKSPAQDANDILRMMTQLALAHPEVRLQLVNNQDSMLDAVGASFQDRVKCVLGEDFVREMRFIEQSEGELQVKGFVGSPQASRPNRTGQFLLLNRRAVSCPAVAYAIREAYGTALGTHRFPAFALHITVPGSLVDVNVHPQKREVRLRRIEPIKQLLQRSVDGALNSYTRLSPIVPQIQLETVPWVAPKQLTMPHRAEPTPFSTPSLPLPAAPLPSVILPPSAVSTVPGYVILDPRTCPPLGEGLYLLDQRAAHQRVVFERMEKKESSTEAQPLLIPQTHQLSPPDAAFLREAIAQLHCLGYEISDLGKNTFAVHAVPMELHRADLKSVLEEFLEELAEAPTSDNKLQRMAQAASRVAMPKNRWISLEEARRLLKALVQCTSPGYLPMDALPLLVFRQINLLN